MRTFPTGTPLLTDEELAAGQQAWLAYPNPFGSWVEEEITTGRENS